MSVERSEHLPDLVYTVRPGETNHELRYSLRSVARNLPHRLVWIVGHKPTWVTGVRYIPTAQPHTDWAHKHENQTRNLQAACKAPDVSASFVLMNDDFYVIRPVQCVPVMHGGTVARMSQEYRRLVPEPQNYFILAMERNAYDLTANHGVEDPLNYDLHVPMPLDKEIWEAVLYGCTAFEHHVHKRTRYGNLYHIGGMEIHDVKATYGSDLQAQQVIAAGGAFISTNDDAFEQGPIGRVLASMFRDPCRYETGKGPFDDI